MLADPPYQGKRTTGGYGTVFVRCRFQLVPPATGRLPPVTQISKDSSYLSLTIARNFAYPPRLTGTCAPSRSTATQVSLVFGSIRTIRSTFTSQLRCSRRNRIGSRPASRLEIVCCFSHVFPSLCSPT